MKTITDEISGWTVCDDGRVRDEQGTADYYALQELKAAWRSERNMKRGIAKLIILTAFFLIALAVMATK